MQILSQKDARWGSLKINNTTYNMAGWGCFVTAVSMVADILPTEALKKLRFDGAMLIWESIANVGLEPIFKGDWDNAKALDYVEKNGQCIARVDFDGSDRTDDTHFVVLIGNKRLYDPIDGKEKATSAYSKYTGIRACRKISMNTDEIAVKKSVFENLVAKSSSYDEILARYNVADAQGLFNMVQGKDSRITDLTNQLGTAQAEVKNKEEIVSRLKVELLNKDDAISQLNTRLEEAQKTVAQLGKDKGTLAIENEKLKIRITTLEQQAAQGQVTLTIGDILKLIFKQKITISKG